MDIQELTEKVREKPENILLQFSLGQALFEEEKYADAIAPLQTCSEKKSDWMMARILLGKAYLQLQKPAEAKACLEQALQLAIAQQHEDPEKEVRELLDSLD
ncbi:MAG: tetratricopeptide repeat protein [Opitutales bacterium]|nr:tetratricopeptide repeat protein [Opitutales bacterium]MCH8541803.1 tetratricopeptide repeat protein [Opitutales bacterium]